MGFKGPALKHTDSELARVASLTAKQRECLHLVVLRKSSREIARILGISKPAVDQRLMSARRVLGVSTRDEAALIYARVSGNYDRILYDPVGAPPGITGGSPTLREEHANAYMLEKVSLPYDVDIEQDSHSWPQILTDAKDKWGTAQKIAILAVLTIGILAIILIGLSVSQSLSKLLTV
jgi:DNA-binding CsgD family transcriptional regulator